MDAPTNATASRLRHMVLRLYSAPNTTIAQTSMTLDDLPLPDVEAREGANAIMLFDTETLLTDGFTLSGTLTMSWTGPTPAASDLGLQIFPGELPAT